MTDQAIRVVAAGWYEDPVDPAKVRWWNGLEWTEHTAAKPGAATMGARVEQKAAAEDDRPGATPSRTASSATTQPATRRAARAAEGSSQGPDGARSATGAVWVIGLIPVIALVLTLVGGYVYFYAAPSPAVALVALVPYALGILLAVADSRQLAARGFRAPSPLWALFTPLAYVIARRVRVPGNGPLVLIAVTAVLALVLPILVALSGAARPVTIALTVQQTAVRELVDTGRLRSVSCPPFVESLAAGTLFTCDATRTDGLPTRVWVSVDSSDGDFSLAPAV